MSKEKTTIKLVDAPVYSYLEALYRSFYSKRLYVDVGKRWRGLGLVYLLLVVVVYTIPLSVRIGFDLNRSINEHIIEPLKLLPTLYVQNGQVSLDKPVPYFIRNKHQDVVAIIDTTNHIKDFSSQFPELSILINKETISLKMPTPKLFKIATPNPESDKPIVQTFEKGSNFVFNGTQFAEDDAMTRMKWFPQLLTYPVVISTVYGLFLVLFLVFGFLGQLFARIFFSFKLSIVQSCRLFMVSSTPVLCVLMLCFATNLFFVGLGLILLIALFVYYSFAVYALKSESRRVVSA